jgi:hypothetical protein
MLLYTNWSSHVDHAQIVKQLTSTTHPNNLQYVDSYTYDFIYTMNDPLGPHAEARDTAETQDGPSNGITLSPRAAKVTLGTKEKSVGAQGPEMKDTMSFVCQSPTAMASLIISMVSSLLCQYPHLQMHTNELYLEVEIDQIRVYPNTVPCRVQCPLNPKRLSYRSEVLLPYPHPKGSTVHKNQPRR